MIDSDYPISFEDWKKVTLGDIARNISENENHPKAKGLDRCVGLEHIDPDSLHIRRWSPITEEMSFTRKFSKGQILFGKRRAYQKKVALAEFNGICSSDILVIEAINDNCIPELLPFIVQDDRFFEYAVETSSGSLSPRTKWKFLAEYELLLPSLSEQGRISTMFLAVEDCIIKGERVLAAAERAKQVLMRELFSKGIGHEEFKEVKGFGIIPATWECNPLDQLCQQITVGIVVKPASHYVEKGIPTLRSLNIRQDRIVAEDMVYISPTDNDTVLSKSKLRKGDVLVVRTGYPGTSCVVPKEYEGTNCIDLIIIRTKGMLLNDYLSRYLNSPEGKQQILIRSAGLAQQHLNTSEIKKLIIPYGPFEEQRQIATILIRCDDTIAAAHANVGAAKALKMKLITELFSRK